MIKINDTMFPFVKIYFVQSDWNDEDYVKFQEKVEKVFDRARDKKTRVKLFIQANSKILKNPSMGYYYRVVKNIKSWSDQYFADCLDKTAICKPSKTLEVFFNLLFTFYTPKREILMSEDVDKLMEFLEQN